MGNLLIKITTQEVLLFHGNSTENKLLTQDYLNEISMINKIEQ